MRLVVLSLRLSTLLKLVNQTVKNDLSGTLKVNSWRYSDRLTEIDEIKCLPLSSILICGDLASLIFNFNPSLINIKCVKYF